MNQELVDQIVNAVLYEGYILYPYCASAKKNRQRFTFGRVYPEAYSVAQNEAEPCMMQTECLVEGPSPTLEVKVRFLHPMSREIGRLPSSIEEDRELEPSKTIPELRVGDNIYQSWQEAVEREVSVQPLSLRSLSEGMKSVAFEFPESRTAERIFDAEQRPAGVRDYRRLHNDDSGRCHAAGAGSRNSVFD
jgi:hydrogenase maturation protease